MEQEGNKPWEEVFKAGRFQVETRDTTKHGSTTAPPPPQPVLMSFPTESGKYPVLLFIHGFLLSNSCYTQLLEHIASHGYITIAPQMAGLRSSGFDATQAIDDAAAISDWVPGGLSYYLPDEVRPELQNIVIAGHSRGGKVAFGLALGRISGTTKVKFCALVGVDPVDGITSCLQTTPHILTYKPHSFDLDMPTLVIGSGLGSEWNVVVPPCAPKRVNHRDFFSECSSPAHHFVASEFGHMDFLNDDTGDLISVVCKNGVTREPMRRFSGGIIVAFLNAYLKKDSVAFNDLLVHPSHAPVILEPPQSFVSEVESKEFPLLQKV